MSNWFETLDGLWDQAWDQLAQGVADAAHPARRVTFATISPDGWPEARTVVLRLADQASVGLQVQTDLHSDKIKSLQSTPRAAVHVWLEDHELQIRIQCAVTIQSGAEVAETWKQVPDISRQSYGVTPAPGQPIAHALDYVKSPDPATFAVLTCTAETMDLVHLGGDHRRARYTRARDWNGEWLVP